MVTRFEALVKRQKKSMIRVGTIYALALEDGNVANIGYERFNGVVVPMRRVLIECQAVWVPNRRKWTQFLV